MFFYGLVKSLQKDIDYSKKMSVKQKYKKDSFTGKKGKCGTEGNELKCYLH